MDTELRWVDYLNLEIGRWHEYMHESIRRIGVALVSISLLVWTFLESLQAWDPSDQELLRVTYISGVIGASGLMAFRRTFSALHRAMGLSGRSKYLDIIPPSKTASIVGLHESVITFTYLLAFLVAILCSGGIDEYSRWTAVFLVIVLLTSAIGIIIQNVKGAEPSKATYKRIISRTREGRLKILRLAGDVAFVCLMIILPAASLYYHGSEHLEIRSIQLSLEILAIAAVLYWLLAMVSFYPVIFRISSGLNTMRRILLVNPDLSESGLAKLIDRVYKLEPLNEADISDDLNEVDEDSSIAI